MNMSVGNSDINGEYWYTNSSTGSELKNHNYVDYTMKRYEISANIYLREINGLPDDVDIDDMLPASSLNQYVNMEYIN